MSLILTSQAFAAITFTRPIQVRTEINAWTKHLTLPAQTSKGVNIQCAEVTEVKQLYICAGDYSKNINFPFMRASFWAEADLDIPHHHLFSNADPKSKQLVDSAGGVDLTSEDLIAFLKAVKIKCAEDPGYCLSAKEKLIFDQIVNPLLKTNGHFVIITYSVADDEQWKLTASHELHHGQYFLDLQYRKAIDQLWSEVMTDQDRQFVKSNFIHLFNSSEEFLIKNEFQAMLLESDSRYIAAKTISRLKPVFVNTLLLSGTPVIYPQGRSATSRARL